MRYKGWMNINYFVFHASHIPRDEREEPGMLCTFFYRLVIHMISMRVECYSVKG